MKTCVLCVSSTKLLGSLLSVGESPAFERLYREVALPRERVVVERRAGLRPPLVEVGVDPDAELAVARAHDEAVGVALEEVLVLARPLEGRKVGPQREDEGLARSLHGLALPGRRGEVGAEGGSGKVLYGEEAGAVVVLGCN